jgi:membrane-anchored protein YejM (alkaline phosphatase superfamily)
VPPAPGAGGPLAERRACYDTAVHFADGQVGQVLEDVERRGLLQNTVVIVTSDHGEEFNETGEGFKGHGSGYDRYQLQTPMLVHWPGRSPGRVARRTSHNDVAPTLLSELLGCANPPEEYSSGHGLFSDKQWDWLVASSYTGFAVVEPDQVTVSYGSYFEVRDREYKLVESPRIRADVVSQAIRETGRFFRND